MASLDRSLRALEDVKDARQAADVMRRIVDIDGAERIRALRVSEKEGDIWLANSADVLNDLYEQNQDLERVYRAGKRFITLSYEQLFDEARRLGFSMEKIELYRKNSLLLRRIGNITDYAAAAAFLATVPGVQEISRRVYEEALDGGRQISAERKKENSGELFEEKVARRMIPVLLKCEYVQNKQFVQRYFLALHDADNTNSFARKVVQSVKEHLRTLFPSFADLLLSMQAKITVEGIRDFLFEREDKSPLTATAKAPVWLNERKRRYAVLLERRVREEEIEVLDVASVGDGPDELSTYIGRIFRYRVYNSAGDLYPELRHVRDNCHPLYRFLLKVLRDSGWTVPEQWPEVRFPQNWNRNWK